MQKIPYVNLKAQSQEEKYDLMKLIEDILESSQYVGGNIINDLEKELSLYCGSKYVIMLNSGTDALIIALKALGIGNNDEVITPPNSFIASTASILQTGATPVFMDVLEDQNINPELMEEKITSKTKAIMPVHLTGRICEMNQILDIAKKYNLYVIEDAAQSIGSKYFSKKAGTIGNVGCFSAHPLKNLNAMGDAGFLTTDDKDIARFAKLYRNHGMVDRNTVELFGTVSRMDAIQATILTYRLKKLPNIIEKRRNNAKYYFKNLNLNKVFVPLEKEYQYNTYHTFVIQVEERDALKDYLLSKGVETAIHYPIPIHLQPAAKELGYKKGDFIQTENQSERILTLPIHQYLTEENLFHITQSINGFFR